MPNCQECKTPIPVEEDMPDLGEVLVCPACGAEYEIISVEPLEMELIEEEK